MSIEIIPYQASLKQHFIDMNLEWLESLFYVEAYDKLVLNNCEEKILALGGFIFFAQQEETIVGTVALIKLKENDFELSKMAVSPSKRGQKIGHQLMEHCIAFAKSKQWPKLTIYSNTKLENAIHLYKKYGFVEIPVESNVAYDRCDIKMEVIF